jgi:hypothetical protein
MQVRVLFLSMQATNFIITTRLILKKIISLNFIKLVFMC